MTQVWPSPKKSQLINYMKKKAGVRKRVGLLSWAVLAWLALSTWLLRSLMFCTRTRAPSFNNAMLCLRFSCANSIRFSDLYCHTSDSISQDKSLILYLTSCEDSAQKRFQYLIPSCRGSKWMCIPISLDILVRLCLSFFLASIHLTFSRSVSPALTFSCSFLLSLSFSLPALL